MRLFACLSFVVVLAVCGSCARFEGQGAAKRTVRPGTGVYFVATNGQDQWSGTMAAPNRQDDGPFRTIQRALRAVGDLKQQQGGTWKQPVTIFVRGGTHWLNEPVVITPELSGTSDAPLCLS
ncbi:MAG: hypothetical protein JWM68_673, partial [Verrucomicrobiales bacterium]|nr:hypothetical protein [Verrucomicrobiales bacterium]